MEEVEHGKGLVKLDAPSPEAMAVTAALAPWSWWLGSVVKQDQVN